MDLPANCWLASRVLSLGSAFKSSNAPLHTWTAYQGIQIATSVSEHERTNTCMSNSLSITGMLDRSSASYPPGPKNKTGDCVWNMKLEGKEKKGGSSLYIIKYSKSSHKKPPLLPLTSVLLEKKKSVTMTLKNGSRWFWAFQVCSE